MMMIMSMPFAEMSKATSLSNGQTAPYSVTKFHRQSDLLWTATCTREMLMCRW